MTTNPSEPIEVTFGWLIGRRFAVNDLLRAAADARDVERQRLLGDELRAIDEALRDAAEVAA